MEATVPIQDITFCIKTIHRPWACHRLVQSLRNEFGEPKIVVVDDGLPEHWFSRKYPETAKHCKVIDLEQHDVGVGVGRNTAIDAAETEFIFLLDDDQIVTPDLHLDRVYQRFIDYDLDILAVRQGAGGRPMLFSPLMNGSRIWMHRGEHKRMGETCWCDMVSNAFLARRDTIARLRWDDEIKTYEHWEFFYRASQIEHLQIAVALDCSVVHAFAGDDRGWHLLSVLERVSKLAGQEIQRIGLSATVGNPEVLLTWIAGNCQGKKSVAYPPPSEAAPADVQIDYVGSLENAATVISRLHRGEKRLVFLDSRAGTEELGLMLKSYGVNAFVTHSSLSQEERHRTEKAFAQESDCVIVATSVLELGIDVGDLDRVIQIDAPLTVASFLQRMGRTGRRQGSVRNCLMLATKPERLLQAAALTELWESGFVEPIIPPPEPYHILSQQLMALALQESGIGRLDWFKWIEGVYGFSQLPKESVDELVRWMIDTEILSDDSGLLWLGAKGEQTFGRQNFMELFSVFMTPPIFRVLHGRQEIGQVDESALTVKQDGPRVLSLGGNAWKVNYIDWQRKIAFVDHELGMLVEHFQVHRTMSIEGPGGIGKTQLLIQVLQRLPIELSVLWIDIQSYKNIVDIELAVEAALATYATANGRSLLDKLANLELTLVFDGVEDLLANNSDELADFFQSLITHTKKPRFVFTSQIELHGVDIAKRFIVGPLSREVGMSILQWNSAVHSPRVENDHLEWLASFCEGHPLALTLVRGLLDYFKSAAAVVRRVSQQGAAALAAPTRKLHSPSTSLRACLMVSYQTLTLDQRKCLFLISHSPAGCIDKFLARSPEYTLEKLEDDVAV